MYRTVGLQSAPELYVDTIMTPTGEEIVPTGWDTEPTVIRKVDQVLLDFCSNRNHTTTRLKAVR